MATRRTGRLDLRENRETELGVSGEQRHSETNTSVGKHVGKHVGKYVGRHVGTQVGSTHTLHKNRVFKHTPVNDRHARVLFSVLAVHCARQGVFSSKACGLYLSETQFSQ